MMQRFKFYKVKSKAPILLALLLGVWSATLSMSGLAAEPQEPSSIGSLTLEELMKIQIAGASHERKQLRETPAIVSVITAEDIHNSGARDLIDVLNLVPGLTLAEDVQGVVDIAVRGIWAHEGKVLLQIDGQELNDLSFNTLQLGNHFPVDSISRIEVIRGPGSAVHGRYAELAVINVITKGVDELEGVQVEGIYGQMSRSYAQRDIALGYGGRFGDWKLSGYAMVGQGVRSQSTYTDSQGTSFDMKDNSKLNPAYANLGLSNETWDLRLILDQYHTADRTAFGASSSHAMNMNFDSVLVGVKYFARLNDRVSLMPELHYKANDPWNNIDPGAWEIEDLYYDVQAREYSGILKLKVELSPDLVAYAGVDGRIQHAETRQPERLFANGEKRISYYGEAAFTEVVWDTDLASFTLGARYQAQNVGGGAFVPRLSAVKQFGDFHTKLLYGSGFRGPGIENLRLNPSLKPEKSTVAEVEVGCQFSKEVFGTMNFFSEKLENPITYFSTEVGESYNNTDTVKTYGLETDIKFRGNWGYLDLNYSYSRNRADSGVDVFDVPGHSEFHLGLPSHKLAANLNFKLLDDKTRANLSGTYLSVRYGYDYNPANGTELALRSFDPTFLANFFIAREDVFVKGLTLGAGVYNFLDQDFRYVQPYPGGMDPLPGLSRDWFLKVSYQVKL